MKHGFIKVAAGSVRTTVADTAANAEEIKRRISEADEAGVNLLVLPELCVTGYSCGDLFFSETLIKSAASALEDICAFTAGKYPLVLAGAPMKWNGKLCNCAVAMYNGEMIAVVPKTNLPNHNEFCEQRHFVAGPSEVDMIMLNGQFVPFGTDMVLENEFLPEFCVGVELCEDLWSMNTPGGKLCLGGAAIVANLSASDELVGKADYRRMLVKAASAKQICAYVLANAGPYESTQDLVFSQHHIIAENGVILAENPPFGSTNLVITEVDVSYLCSERMKNTGFSGEKDPVHISFGQPMRETVLTRNIDKNPFIPAGESIRERAEMILNIQAHGLKRRMEHIHAPNAVIGISGGLDSCLALLVMVRSFDLMGLDRKNILAVTMPCFGTTSRTRSNAEVLCELLGVTFKTVDISEAVALHLRDIGHDMNDHSVAFENAQARERTQIIMDMANDTGGLVVGTGDLSELALGWATYNGDHMSMYGVNGSVPKTLVRAIVRCEAEKAGGELEKVLLDILDTPVSPELLPTNDKGGMTQMTEDLVGPYELHDFFLYNMVRRGFGPEKIYRLARYAFRGEYDDATILKWLKTFVRRFFTQQFKRSCLPDGPKVGSVSLSPRGDWHMPSDASYAVWMREAEAL